MDLLLRAYACGAFPMADPDTGAIEWYSPDPRAIIPLGTFHVRKSLEREARKQKFNIRSDTSFEHVIRACATDRSAWNRSWISERLIRAYTTLHKQGFAHSVEAWLDGRLVGGLYGVHIGSAFFGESMFSRPDLGGTNASKICLVHLVRHLRERGFKLLDTQFWNEHLEQFGCVEIPRDAYIALLNDALQIKTSWANLS